MPGTHEVCYIESESDAYNSATLASEYAKHIGFGVNACLEVRIAVSEIAVNAFRYGKNGQMTIKTLNNGKILDIIVKDEGSGLENLDFLSRNGVSSRKTSLGIGLDVAKRNMDLFEIRSGKTGTIVRMQKYLPIPEEKANYGVLSIQDPNYSINGDSYLIKEFDGDKAIISVIDGLGQGEKANKASTAVKKVIQEFYRNSLTDILETCHRQVVRELDKQSGFTVSIAKIARDDIEYIGVGDTFCIYFDSRDMHKFVNNRGLLGSNLPCPTLSSVHLKPAKEFMLLMCSDGIRESIDTACLPVNRPSDQIATYVIREYCREYGDATVLIGKFKNL